ncbi:hypothetical protein DV738_g5437, partial [Chaetothyriales sp. CBS 135597]
MAEKPFDPHPKKKILAVVTVGGSTNVAPILTICALLAQRGHTIELATLQGRQHLAVPYPFISDIHILGRAITASEEKQLYSRLNEWNWNTTQGKQAIVWVKQFHDTFWPETYHSLKRIIHASKPDLIFADYQVDAARDVAREMAIPLAVMWCQMPWLLLPQSYIPGQPGMQQRCLTSEHATLKDRLLEETYLLRSAPYFIRYLCWMRAMRRQAGAMNPPSLSKPDHLLLINSFFGLEPAKDLPPLVHAVGPILSDSFPPLDQELQEFLGRHQRVIYVAFGTHVLLTSDKIDKLTAGLDAALNAGHVDGILWALKPISRSRMDTVSAPVNGLTYGQLFTKTHPDWLFVDYAPQRAILENSSVKLFVTHAGPSSANESLYHGVPMIAIGIYGDQLPNSLRLFEAGVALILDKDKFSAKDLVSAIASISEEKEHHMQRNVLRMLRIARV